MRESLMSSNQLELELLSSFCGVFETQRDNFLVFNLMRAGVTSYSWVTIIQQGFISDPNLYLSTQKMSNSADRWTERTE